MTGLERGDVVLVWFPNSDLKTFKRRPALVVQADGLNTGLPQFVAAIITSNLPRRGHPSRVFIPLQSAVARDAGLRTDSVIMADNLATIFDQAVAQKLGRLADFAEIDRALRATLAL
ncbi:MAG: type II toxin-antitoxin system PemK/MazF family toxin [Verrucomicrobiae bacterium]|nr:type II toxin-antitoxin system PemK/MazF family toxin [Verrucomicrobiae bacterium]